MEEYYIIRKTEIDQIADSKDVLKYQKLFSKIKMNFYSELEKSNFRFALKLIWMFLKIYFIPFNGIHLCFENALGIS